MRFITYEHHGVEKIGVIKCDDNTILDMDYLLKRMRGYHMTQFIEEVTDRELDILEKACNDGVKKGPSMEDVTMKAPIIHPSHDIICVGVNYEDHLKESSLALKDITLDQRSKPVYFSKRAHKILGHKEEVIGHFTLDESLDYEVELAVIIGKEGRDIPRDQVEDYIFGYSIFNDYTSRTLQKEHLQWFKGKSLDGYTVMGPSIVHKREVPYPPEVFLRAYVNGELRQDSHTKNLLFDIDTLISDFSKGITLKPGDIIATGTPSGVGMGFKPPRFLKPGDEVRCQIEGLGTLTNKIRSVEDKNNEKEVKFE